MNKMLSFVLGRYLICLFREINQLPNAFWLHAREQIEIQCFPMQKLVPRVNMFLCLFIATLQKLDGIGKSPLSIKDLIFAIPAWHVMGHTERKCHVSKFFTQSQVYSLKCSHLQRNACLLQGAITLLMGMFFRAFQ